MSVFIIVLIISVLFVVYVIMTYNRLVTLKNRMDEAFSDIDVQFKRRYDLIPNLVNTVKGYATHEKDTLENVTKARSQAMQAGSFEEKAQAENFLSSTLKSLFAVSEAYPDLKANQNFLELQRELTDTENKIQASRRFYNSTVQEFNTTIEMFPSNIIAGVFSFKKGTFFELTNPEEKEPVKVQF